MTNTDICNMALSYLGKGTIKSIDEDTEPARQCKLHYNNCRKMMLRSYSWGFAKRIVKLAQFENCIIGWDFTYAYPEKCLSARYIFEEDYAKEKEYHKEEYDIVLVSDNVRGVVCNIANACMEYMYDATDVAIFPPEFCEALARLLASSIAVSTTGNTALQQMQYQLYQVAIQEAMYQNSLEKERKVNAVTEFDNVRFN